MFCWLLWSLINNSNGTEWSPIRSIIKQVINKIGRLQSGSPICLSRVWLLTELDHKKFCYQLIITISISKKTNTPRTNISSGDNVLSWIFLHFGNCLVFLCISGCCYGYCDQFCDWWIQLSGLSMIGCFNCLITGVWLQPTVRLHCPITTVQKMKQLMHWSHLRKL